MAYEQPIKPHFFRDWARDHPKTVLPIIVFFLGTLTYTVGVYLHSSPVVAYPVTNRYLIQYAN
jgi:hypothetical protein